MKQTLTVIIIVFNLLLNSPGICQTDSIKLYTLIKSGESFSSRMAFDSAVEAYSQAVSICAMQKIWDKYIRCNNELGILMQKKNLRDSSGYYYWKAYKKGLEIWGSENPKMASCYFNIGILYDEKDPIISNLDSALFCYQKAYTFWVQTYGEKHQLVSRVCRRIAFNYQARIELEESLKYFFKELEIDSALYSNNPGKLTGNYGNIGLAYYNMGNYDKGLEYLNKALEIELKYNPLSIKAAACYNNISLIYLDKGDLNNALTYQLKGLDIRLKILPENHEDVAASYNNLSTIYFNKRDYNKALENEKKSLYIKQQIFGDEHFLTARSYNNIGIYYLKTENYQNALDMHFKALAIREKTLPYLNPEIAESFTNIGNVYEKMNEYRKALFYDNKALDIAEKLYKKDHEEIAIYQFNIGIIYQDMQMYDSARYFYQKSADFYFNTFGKNHPSYANRLNSISKSYLLESSLSNALKFNTLSLESSIKNYSDSILIDKFPIDKILYKPELFDILSNRAEILLALSDKNNELTFRINALHIYKYLISLSNSIYDEFNTEQSKFLFAKEALSIFTKAIDNCYKLSLISNNKKFIEEGYTFCQHLKASILLNSINECNAKKYAGIPDSVLSTERKLNMDIALLVTKQKELTLNSHQNSDSIDNLLFAKRKNYQNLMDSIKNNYPRYFELKSNSTSPSLAQLYSKITNNEAILDYVLSDSTLYIFSITHNAIRLNEVETKSSVPELINNYLAALNRLQIKAIPELSNQLYDELIEPVKDVIKTKNKIFIIPDNELWYLPFEALYPKSIKPYSDFTQPEYLVKNVDISYHLSSSIWYLNSQKKREKNSVDFVGFAPVFDQHLSVNDTANCVFYSDSIGNEIAMRSHAINTWKLNPLPYSKKEIDDSRLLFNKKKKTTLAYYYKEANKHNLLDAGYKGNILHIASHAIMNPNEPALSGIFFAPDTSSQESGTNVKPQMLYSGEIFNLNLNADLIVLSACQTGTGKLLRGEGVFSLVRGFMYAGIPNIIYSTWKIGDKNTKQLMVAFYKAYLNGSGYANALRKAKLELISNPETAYPKNWAGISLIGN